MCWVMFHQAHMLVICSEEELFVADALSSAEGKEEGRGGLASPVPWNILRTSPGVETKLRTVSPRSASLPPCWCRDASLFGGSLSASTIVLQVVFRCWTYECAPFCYYHLRTHGGGTSGMENP
ncbi:hypothetical protein AMECASPLE_026643 [Ameca splendens]|uniref:Uncharacterized protein n=1 Tax=Ameca splendens TaxID=208324 RepID=A0ABV0YRY9_9TELE